MFPFFHLMEKKNWEKNMVELFGGRSNPSPSSTGNEVFNMPGAISANPSKKKERRKKKRKNADSVTSSGAHPFPYIPPIHSTLSSSKTCFFFFYILLQIQLLRGRERLLFCLWKINSHYKQDRKTRVKRERQAPLPASLTLPDGCHLP